jgi:hypothetical protein
MKFQITKEGLLRMTPESGDRFTGTRTAPARTEIVDGVEVVPFGNLLVRTGGRPQLVQAIAIAKARAGRAVVEEAADAEPPNAETGCDDTGLSMADLALVAVAVGILT